MGSEKLVLRNLEKRNTIFNEYEVKNRVNRISNLIELFKRLKNDSDKISNKDYVYIVELLYDNYNLCKKVNTNIPGRSNEKITLVLFSDNDEIDNLSLKEIAHRKDNIVLSMYPTSNESSEYNNWHWDTLVNLFNSSNRNKIKNYASAKDIIVTNNDKIVSYKAKKYREILTEDKLTKDYAKFINLMINELKKSVDDYYECIKSNEECIKRLKLTNSQIEENINNVKDILFGID